MASVVYVVLYKIVYHSHVDMSNWGIQISWRADPVDTPHMNTDSATKCYTVFIVRLITQRYTYTDNTVRLFKARLDTLWMHQDVKLFLNTILRPTW